MAGERVTNIILMGETGSGKSTLINAFHNYVTYQTFEEAVDGSELCLVPTTFSLMDKEFNSTTIKAGKDDGNECVECGRSATLTTKSYLFPPTDQMRLRLIDTSGFAASHEPEQDSEIVTDIFNYISQYETIDAIAVVLKGNQSRVTTHFEYCMEQVLVNLDKSAVDNIVFIFTHCTKPGDTLETMKSCLKKFKESSATSPDIKINKNNTYCFDNNVFRNLLAAQNDVTLTENETNQSETDWETASNELKRLLDYVNDLEPHDVTATLSINDIRLFARDLSAISDEISISIDESRPTLKLKKKEIANVTMAIRKQETSSVSIVFQDIRFEQTKTARVVCTSPTCVEKYPQPHGRRKLHFAQVCCEDCRMVPVVGTCHAFPIFSTACRRCKCPSSVHRRIYYRTIKTPVTTSLKDPSTELNTAMSDKERKETALQTIENYLKNMQKEKDTVDEAVATCDAYLKSHAILAYDDGQRVWARNDVIVNRRLDRRLNGTVTAPVSLKEIQNIKKNLLKLQLYGSKISAVCQQTEKSKAKVNREVLVLN